MAQLNFHHNNPPPTLLPITQKIKDTYLVWFEYYQKLPKTHKYSLGKRIDQLFIEVIESVSAATFLNKEEKLPYVKLAIRKTDALKILLLILFEAKSLDMKKYVHLSTKISEFGKMLGGWQGQLLKQNSQKDPGEK